MGGLPGLRLAFKRRGCYNLRGEDNMHTLTDETVIEIAKDVAKANNVSFAKVVTAPIIDSTGSEAIEIKIIRYCPGSIMRFGNWHRQIFLDSGILFRFKDS